jgi:hypothetical protein
MMYPLLTGRRTSIGEKNAKAQEGGKLFLDPRYSKSSLAEAKLVAILEMCQQYDANDRPSIFEVIHLLEKALADVKQSQE